MGYMALVDEAGSIATVISGLKGGITSIATDVMSAVGQILPIALPIMGAIVVVNIGMKVFKKVSSK